jgi:hypothetical protein
VGAVLERTTKLSRVDRQLQINSILAILHNGVVLDRRLIDYYVPAKNKRRSLASTATVL